MRQDGGGGGWWCYHETTSLCKLVGEVPRKSDSYWTTDGDLFRLYFDVNQKLEGETKVSQATLRLYKKSFAGKFRLYYLKG